MQRKTWQYRWKENIFKLIFYKLRLKIKFGKPDVGRDRLLFYNIAKTSDIMKKIFFTLFAFFIISVSFGQILNPVRFSYSIVKKGNNQYEVHVKTIVEPKWHIYSIYNPDGGAQATALSFSDGKAVGKAKEDGKMKTIFEKEFNVNQKYFESGVDFIQIVKVAPGSKKVSGTIEYMVCNDRQCLPPKTVAFDIAL
jgi:hypothetical protein